MRFKCTSTDPVPELTEQGWAKAGVDPFPGRAHFVGPAILVGFYAEFAAAFFGFQMIVGTFWKLKIKKEFSDYSYDLQLFALCLVVMSQGAGVYSLKAFPGTIFLRWDVAMASLAGALLFAVLSKPQLKS